MKKLLLIILSLMLTLVVFAGCSPSKDEPVIEETEKIPSGAEKGEKTKEITIDVENNEYIFVEQTEDEVVLKTPKGNEIEVLHHVHFNKPVEGKVTVKYVASDGNEKQEDKILFVNSADKIKEKKKELDNTANQTEDKTVVSDTKTTNSQKTDTKKPESNSTASTSNNTNNSNTNSGNNSSTNTNSNVSTGNKEQNCRYETRTETIPAWTEQVLVKDGWNESVLVTAAWDETVQECTVMNQDSRHVWVCWHCGGRYYSYDDFINHVYNGGNKCGSFYEDEEYYGEYKCVSWETKTIHHDAVYNNIWHEPEYKTVTHPEETKTYQVEVCD